MSQIPVLHTRGRCIAEAYEQALVALYEHGVHVRTQYDRPGDPPSLDATMNITVDDPLADPMIHKAFPGGIEDLREYVMELSGAKDHWVKNMNDPEDTRWEYTYHGRLARHGVWRELDEGKSVERGEATDQVEAVVAKLCGDPYTRRAQMVTWMPAMDLECYDPPCLQSLWYRILEDDDGVWWLNSNVRFRSNDAWGANFMNMFGFTMFAWERVASPVSERTGRTVRLGRMNWQADSYHIYGKDLAQARQRLFDRLDSTAFSERVFSLSDPVIRGIYDEATVGVREKIEAFDREHS
jgi:thymidylate synthase